MSRIRKKKTNPRNPSMDAMIPASKRKRVMDLGWKHEDENIDSDHDDDDDDHHHDNDKQNRLQTSDFDEEDVEEEETLDAKKVRMAREYLKKIEQDESDEDSSSSSDGDNQGEDDGQEEEEDRIGVKLQRERLKREGALERAVADKVERQLKSISGALQKMSMSTVMTTSTTAEKEARNWIEAGHITLLRGHDLTPTCVDLQPNGEKAVSGSKDHSVILWDMETEKKAFTLCPPWNHGKGGSEASRSKGEVLSVACSDDGRYAAVGKRDATVCIYDIRAGKNNLAKTLTGHKGPVTCLSFRSQSLQLFSGSEDRCIRYVCGFVLAQLWASSSHDN